ncbi:MAG: preprotein translocase subunit YajC [Byssovorax sp.]
MFFDPTTAPGPGAANPPAPIPGQPVQGTPPDAPPPGGPLGGGMSTLLIMLLPIVLIFMTMRGQTKKQKQIEAGLKTGDTVVSQSGLIGKITELNERTVRLEIAPGVSVRMLKSSIQGVDGGDTKPESKDAKDAKDAKEKKS